MKTWLALGMVLISGIVIGIVGTLWVVKSNFIKVMQGDYKMVTNMIEKKLDSKLNFSDQQKLEVSKIIERVMKQLAAIREKVKPEIRSEVMKGIKEIKEMLSEKQIKILRQMMTDFLKRYKIPQSKMFPLTKSEQGEPGAN